MLILFKTGKIFVFIGKELMIDIHSHLLYAVDDGAKDLEESVSMLRDAKAQGIEAMILTPHYRHGMFSYPKEDIENNFKVLKEKADEIGIQIYLGTEQHINSMTIEYLENNRCHTLADTNYMLAEYKHDSEFAFIKASVQDLIFHGYIPIVAHVERYACMQDVKNIALLREIGVMIQVNADAILGKEGLKTKSYTKKLLKKGYVDFVGSDCHGIHDRKNNMGKCREYLYKKYDERYVHKILYGNANEILQSLD